IREITGIQAASLAELRQTHQRTKFKVYDTQIPFYYEMTAYPIPDLLGKCKWIETENSVYRSKEPTGIRLGPKVSNQNLEQLTFPDNSFDVVITSDVMEHVRLDEMAHFE